MSHKALILDIERCVGCGACVVACLDQNDLEPDQGQPPYRRIYQLEENDDPAAPIRYASAGCFHCEDSPCLAGCPTGAIYRDGRVGAVVVNRDRCIGCHSCALACPFGVPRYDAEDRLAKCHLCADRVAAGYQPACVRACPFKALRHENPNDLQTGKERHYFAGLAKGL